MLCCLRSRERASLPVLLGKNLNQEAGVQALQMKGRAHQGHSTIFSKNQEKLEKAKTSIGNKAR